MAETEVETILREIRERVLSGQRTGRDVAASANGGNGAGEPGSSKQLAPPVDDETLATGNLSLISSYLTTTARAWDRLPPVVSNRSGFVARVELWFKRRLRTGTRWFTWEQVNFNAAVHHALRDLLPVLLTYEAESRKLRRQLGDSETRIADLSAQLTKLGAEFGARNDAQRSAHETQKNEVDSRLAELLVELRERDAHLRDEQRVCYKQLALESSEAAVLEDRARRQTQALLDQLTKRVEQLEKGKEV